MRLDSISANLSTAVSIICGLVGPPGDPIVLVDALGAPGPIGRVGAPSGPIGLVGPPSAITGLVGAPGGPAGCASIVPRPSRDHASVTSSPEPRRRNGDRREGDLQR